MHDINTILEVTAELSWVSVYEYADIVERLAVILRRIHREELSELRRALDTGDFRKKMVNSLIAKRGSVLECDVDIYINFFSKAVDLAD